LKLGKN